MARVPYIPQLPEENRPGQYVEPDDFEAIAAHLPEHVADFARFAYLVPWRPLADIRPLGWDAVDLRSDSPTVRLKTSKNGRPVSVPLVADLLDLLRKRERARTIKTANGPVLCELVFHNDRGQPVCHRFAWKRATEAAGLAGVRLYDLKHSAITNLIRSGCDEKTAMEISGHKTRSAFDRYHIVREDAKGEALARAFERNRSQSSGPRVVPIRSRSKVG